MVRGVTEEAQSQLELTERQQGVLRALVSSYLGQAAPVGSATLSRLLARRISSASIRNTLAELSELGLVEQPHPSAGRLPSEAGLRVFIDRLLGPPPPVTPYDRRAIDYSVAGAAPERIGTVASRLLSEQTRLLGFVWMPPMDRAVLDQVSLVRISSDRILAVLVATTGETYQRLVSDDAGLDARQLERISALLRERVRGRTLAEVRSALADEAQLQRKQADRLLAKAVDLGLKALSADEGGSGDDLVIATWLALLDQPEFRDSDRIRELFEAIETKERLLDVLDDMLSLPEPGTAPGVQVALGGEVDEPALHRCALVAARYGSDAPGRPSGAVGVIGPSRMDYGRAMTLVGYVAESLTGKLSS